MQITTTTLSPNTQSAIQKAANDLNSGVPFEIPVSTQSGTEILKGEFHYGFIQPAGQDIYFVPGQSGAPEAAKRAMMNALQQFLLAAQEDDKAGGTNPTAGHAIQTYSTSASFRGQNSSFAWSGTFSLGAGGVSKTA